jgi:hypothetical protein
MTALSVCSELGAIVMRSGPALQVSTHNICWYSPAAMSGKLFSLSDQGFQTTVELLPDLLTLTVRLSVGSSIRLLVLVSK